MGCGGISDDGHTGHRTHGAMDDLATNHRATVISGNGHIGQRISRATGTPNNGYIGQWLRRATEPAYSPRCVAVLQSLPFGRGRC